MQGPAVEKLAEEGYNVGKINVDDEGELAERYHVMNIPTLIIFQKRRRKRAHGRRTEQRSAGKQIKRRWHKAL